MVAKLLTDTETEVLAQFAAAVQQGQAKGHIDAALVPEVTAQLLLVMVDGFIGRFATQSEIKVDAIAQHAKQMVLNLLSVKNQLCSRGQWQVMFFQ
ncbi:MAG: hypothetical protein ACFBSF_12500 [Leptolyngbyaceae cyanobacterium]